MFSALLLLLFLLMLEDLMHDEVAGVPAAMTIFAKKGLFSGQSPGGTVIGTLFPDSAKVSKYRWTSTVTYIKGYLPVTL